MGNKWWSIFFGVVLFATFIIWPIAPFYGWWLPENVSSFGDGIDFLFYLILGFTTFFFVLTEMVLVYAMYKFVARPGEKSTYTHGNHRLEVFWTIVPAMILIGIAVGQIPVWARIKYQRSMPSPDLVVTMTARQWEWRMRYPVSAEQFKYADDKDAADKQRQARLWAEVPQIDDLHATNELHSWLNANTKVYIRTLDVLHSFTMPNLRLKQDTLPGKTIPMWFRAEKANTRFALFAKSGEELTPTIEDGKIIRATNAQGSRVPLEEVTGKIVETGNKADAWEIACQELCGARHYAMRGRLYIHKTKASYDLWAAYSKMKQQARSVADAAGR